MARILVVEPVAQPAVDHLATAHDTEVRSGTPRGELLQLLGEGGGWDALVVRSQTRVDAELLAAAAPRLSVVGVASVGIDRIDVDAATRAGVMVVNAPTGNTIAAAEHTMALMLALLRHVPRRGRVGQGRGVGARRATPARSCAERSSASSGSGRSARRSRVAPSASRCGSSPAIRT